MNKVTQSIYKNKVDELENNVNELLSKPQSHLYVFSFTSGNFQSIQFFIPTTEELTLTVSAIYDYVLEATKYHNNNRYNLPLSGFYSDTASTSETYGKWIAESVGAMQPYPSATATKLKFRFVKSGEPGATKTFEINKEWLESIFTYMAKIY